MKKIIALLLCIATLCAIFCACTTLKDGDKGMEIDVYLGDQLSNFDPALSYTDSSMMKIFSLIYEGLTTLDSKGNWQKALMSDYKLIENEEDNEYKVQITLCDTRWSDGRTLQAADVVYAWRNRILDPTFKCDAASLLFDIKNAYEAKQGDCSIYDVGIKAISTYVVEIQFKQKTDINEFFKKIASVALVPLREDVVTVSSTWSMAYGAVVTNGPFTIKSYTKDKVLRLERNAFYRLSYDDELMTKDRLDKFVIPYRLNINFAIGDLNDQFEAFLNNDVLYLGEIPLDKRSEYASKATIEDELNTYCFYFNTNVAPFDDANVRKALSLALDRKGIADTLVFADPATGYIPNKISDASNKKTFRSASENLISSSADIAEAQKLINAANAKGKTVTLTIRDNEEDVAIANIAKEAWEKIGLNVEIRKLGIADAEEGAKSFEDLFVTAYKNGDFEIVAIDSQLTTNDAFSALAQFAVKFSGNGVDMNSVNYDSFTHITGYNSAEYDALIEAAYKATSKDEQYSKLHEAEELLLEDLPIIPVVFTKDAYLVSKDLSGISSTFSAARDLKQMKQKNYYEYKTSRAAE